jgi:hypothetical protein
LRKDKKASSTHNGGKMNHSPNAQLIRRHVILLMGVLIILGGTYWLSQSLIAVSIGGVVIILIHLLAATGFLYLGGSHFIGFIQKLHEPPSHR